MTVEPPAFGNEMCGNPLAPAATAANGLVPAGSLAPAPKVNGALVAADSVFGLPAASSVAPGFGTLPNANTAFGAAAVTAGVAGAAAGVATSAVVVGPFASNVATVAAGVDENTNVGFATFGASPATAGVAGFGSAKDAAATTDDGVPTAVGLPLASLNSASAAAAKLPVRAGDGVVAPVNGATPPKPVLGIAANSSFALLAVSSSVNFFATTAGTDAGTDAAAGTVDVVGVDNAATVGVVTIVGVFGDAAAGCTIVGDEVTIVGVFTAGCTIVGGVTIVGVFVAGCTIVGDAVTTVAADGDDATGAIGETTEGASGETTEGARGDAPDGDTALPVGGASVVDDNVVILIGLAMRAIRGDFGGLRNTSSLLSSSDVVSWPFAAAAKMLPAGARGAVGYRSSSSSSST